MSRYLALFHRRVSPENGAHKKSLVETQKETEFRILISTIRRFPSEGKRFVTVVFDGKTIKRNEFLLIAFYEVKAEQLSMKHKIYNARDYDVVTRQEKTSFCAVFDDVVVALSHDRWKIVFVKYLSAQWMEALCRNKLFLTLFIMSTPPPDPSLYYREWHEILFYK